MTRPTHAKAAVLTGKEQIEMMEFPIPTIGENDGLLRVESCGVCGLDSEGYLHGGNAVFKLPCIIGHEIVGYIDEIGPRSRKALEGKERGSCHCGGVYSMWSL